MDDQTLGPVQIQSFRTFFRNFSGLPLIFK